MANVLSVKPVKASSPVARSSSPFQATKLWNQMIRNFREGIELKKRRWKMKAYENTFCGHDAVDWFLLYLRGNQKFGNHVTRPQAKMLLQKFYENGIFEDARGKEKDNFEDDNHLYRFTEKADSVCRSKTELATQRSVTNLLRSVSVRRKPNSAGAGRGNPVTRSQSMRSALMSPSTSVMPADTARVTPIAQNLQTFCIDSTEKERPMGDINQNMIDGSNVDIKTLPEIEQPNFDMTDEENYTSILQDAGIDNRAFVVTEMSPLVSGFQRSRSLRDARTLKYRHKFVVNCEEEDIPNEPSFAFNKSIRRSKLKRMKSGLLVTGLSYTKTGHYTSPSKKAKIQSSILEDQNAEFAETTVCNKENVVQESGPIPHFERKKSLRPSVRSNTTLKQLQRKTSLRTNSFCSAIEEIDAIWRIEAIEGLKKNLEIESVDELVNLSLISDHDTKANIHLELKSAEIPEWTLSAMKYLVEWPASKNLEADSDLPSYEGFENDVFRAIQDHYESSLKEPLMTYNMFKLFDALSGTIAKDRCRALKSFQCICLLIPTWNRKQIFLILRFMDKVAKNLLLKLSQDLPNKELLVRSFHRIIIRNKEMNFPEKDNMTSVRAVTFMVDNHEQILSVPQELKDLKIDFEKRQKESEIQKKQAIQATSTRSKAVDAPPQRPVSLCVQYAKEEYLKQSVDSTRQALVELLELVVSDDTLHPKIKKKRLKEFKKNYPDIYQSKFPEDNISTCSTTSQRTLRLRQAIRPFFFNKRNSEF